MKFGCWHKWAKWEDHARHKTYASASHNELDLPIYIEVEQRKRCVKCNVLKVRMVRT